MKPSGSFKAELLALPPGDYIECDTAAQRIEWLHVARRLKISVATIKLRDGGFLILKLKQRVLYRCPKCHYMR
jgi:hypothetical protein